MTATEQLRRLLDERGVKYRDYFHANKTWWGGRENVGWYAENRLSASGLYVMIEAVLTPEQAIAATLGDVDLAAENAKLRELLADAWGYINHPANATWTHKKRKEVRDSIGDRMRKLGIEVNDGTEQVVTQ